MAFVGAKEYVSGIDWEESAKKMGRADKTFSIASIILFGIIGIGATLWLSYLLIISDPSSQGFSTPLVFVVVFIEVGLL